MAEAHWLASFFASCTNQEIGLVLNVGSSSGTFRKEVQPYINQEIFEPLRTRGVSVLHNDIRIGDGIDLAANILDDHGFSALEKVRARTVICSNVLEHVPSTEEMARRLAAIVPSGGLLLVTAPSSYPYHPDPIDNGFRPSISQLEALFPQFTVVEQSVVEGEMLLNDLARRPLRAIVRILRTFVPFPRVSGWLSTVDRWRWLFRPYKATCVALRKG